MKTRKLLAVLCVLFVAFFFSCSENTPPEPKLSSEAKTTSQSKTSANPKLSKVEVFNPIPDQLQYGTKKETDYVFDHFSAKPGIEFGIGPLLSQQYDPAILQELHSYWGFNYVAIVIGNPTTVSNAQNIFGIDHTMACIEANDAGRNVVEFNTNNGLSPTTYFWAYYTDEPATAQNLSSYGLDSFENFVHEKRPYSLFGFGDVTRQEIGNYITNTITNSLGQTFPNPYPVSPDFVMCTKYDGENIPRWDFIKDLTTKFTRTWINNEKDVGEFNTILNYLKTYSISPWLYVATNDAQNRVCYIWDYCNAAYLQGFLDRYYKQYEVWYHCILNHTHDPEAPWECSWVEDTRIYQGIVQR